MLQRRGRGGYLALESHIICSSIRSCMESKVDVVCYTLNSIFLIGPKMMTAQRKKMRTDFFCDLIPDFSSFSSSFFSALYHASFAPSHLGYAHLV